MASPEREITPAERELRQAKEVVHSLNQLLAQLERGATSVDMVDTNARLQQTLARMQSLSRGVVLEQETNTGTATASSSGSAGTASTFAVAGAVHARQAGSAVVTEMQRRRAQQVLSELHLIEQSLERHARRNAQRSDHASNVAQLLGSYDGARTDYTEMDQLERERKALQYSRQRMQQMSAESDEVLAALQSQGGRMGGVGDKMADMMETIGVSNTTILHIVRRNQMDAWLVYGGILLMLFFMWYIW